MANAGTGWEAGEEDASGEQATRPGDRRSLRKLLQEVYFRLDSFTLCYPAMYLKFEGNTIILPTGGGGKWGPKCFPNIIAHLTETPPEHFHEVAVSRDARGNYYCSFVYDYAEQGIQDNGHKPRTRRRKRKRPMRDDGIVAFDLGIKVLATGCQRPGTILPHRRLSRATAGTIHNSTRFAPSVTAARSTRRRQHPTLECVQARRRERKRHKQRDCLHKASHLIAHRLAERAVVIGDLSQRQMVIKKQEGETRQRAEQAAVCATAWSTMIGASTALCRCSHTSVCVSGKNSL